VLPRGSASQVEDKALSLPRKRHGGVSSGGVRHWNPTERLSTPQRSPWARLNLPVNPISGEIVGEND
jgi:hypothetical protein